MTKIGANIKKVRTSKGLSQQAFADLFELTRGNISSYEENRAEPRIETVLRIANYFCIPVDKFITHLLTVNEILRYNGDKLLEGELHLHKRQLREVPFLNDAIYMKCCYKELHFTDREQFPQLVLPESTSNPLLAVAYNNAIPHPASVPSLHPQDVLVFEEVNSTNIHLCHQNTGLFTGENEIMMGQFEIDGKQIQLVLNQFKKQQVDLNSPQTFWKLFALYQHLPG